MASVREIYALFKVAKYAKHLEPVQLVIVFQQFLQIELDVFKIAYQLYKIAERV
jgi:hypothetical protein